MEDSDLVLDLSDYDSPEEVYDTLSDNDISEYETNIDTICDTLRLSFENIDIKEEAEFALVKYKKDC